MGKKHLVGILLCCSCVVAGCAVFGGALSALLFDPMPQSMVARDLDGDGVLELAVANTGGFSPLVSVLSRSAGTTYDTTIDIYGGSQPPAADFNTVATADVDGDGDWDLISAKGAFRVWLNLGGGSFEAGWSSESFEAGALSLAVGDWDGDGDTDFAVADPGQDQVSLYLNDGNGEFAAGQVVDVGDSPASIVAADLDADGNLDLVTANSSSNDVSVLLGAGDGTFGAAVEFDTAESPSFVASGDLDGDGDTDLAVACWADVVSVLLNDGNGAFAAGDAPGVGDLPECLALADFDQDGDMDIAAMDGAANTVSILLNAGDGTFADAVDIDSGGTDSGGGALGNTPAFMVSADFDGDADADLAVVHYPDGQVAVLLNDGAATFTPAG